MATLRDLRDMQEHDVDRVEQERISHLRRRRPGTEDAICHPLERRAVFILSATALGR